MRGGLGVVGLRQGQHLLAACVGTQFYEPVGTEFKANNGRGSLRDALRVAWTEPRALLRMLMYMARNMQDLALGDLGKVARFDPRYRPVSVPGDVAIQRWWGPHWATPVR